MSYLSAFSKGIQPDPLLTVSQWADQRRILPRTSTKEYGQYRTSRVPYLREPMDCLSVHSPVRRVVAMKPTQVGWTEMANNWLFYIADICPGPCMMVLPTVELAKRHVKSKVQPSLREMPLLQAKIREVKDKRSEETFIKEFPGGFWQFIGAGSASALRSVSIKYLIKDDLDGWEVEVGVEGDPSEIVDKRTDSYGNTAKILEISTPTDKEFSRIDRAFSDTDQSHYYVPCPHCKKEQILELGTESSDFGLKWPKDKPQQTTYLCTHCHTPIPEYHKSWMLENGLWVPTYPDRKYDRGFKFSSLYSPIGWVSWEKIIREFLKTKIHGSGTRSDPTKLKVFVNTRLGNSWEEPGERPVWSTLSARAEPYPILTSPNFRIPPQSLILTAGVDVQRDRLAVLITGWGRGEECWILFWGELWGDPEKPQLWIDLDSLLFKTYIHSSGTALTIASTAVDSGALTQIVYNYVRTRSTRVITTKGQSQSGKPIIGRPTPQDINYRGEVIKEGVKVWPVGTDTAKDLLYPRLLITTPGPGMIHTPIGLPDDFYQQLTSEKKITKFVKGFPRPEWVLPSGNRNEALDCMVLNLAAAMKIGLSRIPWDRLEKNILGRSTQTQNSGQPIPNQSSATLINHPSPPRPRSKTSSKSCIQNLTLRH